MSKKLNSQDWLHIALFDQVCNLDELKQGLIANEITAALVNPTLLVVDYAIEYFVAYYSHEWPSDSKPIQQFAVSDQKYIRYHLIKGDPLKNDQIAGIFQLLVAAFKASHLQRINKMKTRNVHSELIYSLSPTKNIAESFKKFGLSTDSNAVIVAVIDTETEENSQKFNHAIHMVKGQRLGIEKIENFFRSDDIKKVYGITDNELTISDLVDAVVNKMAIKDA